MDYDVYAMENFYDHDVHLVDTVANAVMSQFGVRAYANYDSRMVTVYGVDADVLRDFVQMFGDAVHDVGYDYDYGYDEYLDSLQVADDRVVLYCGVALYSLD